MTSILGIKCEKGLEGVVVISDFCGIQTKWIYEGGVFAHKQERRTKSKKLYVDRNREVLIGGSGITDNAYLTFLSQMIKDSSPIRKAVESKRGHLRELFILNVSRRRKMGREENNPTSLILATRYNNNPRLFYCDPDGYLEENPTVPLGSGADLITEYISKQGKTIPSLLSIDQGLRLGFRCMQEAYRDPFTSGIDLAVITKAEIDDELGKAIRDSIIYARRNAIQEVINSYRQQNQ